MPLTDKVASARQVPLADPQPALEKAIAICGSQSELARRIGGKVKTGHIYHWLRNGVPPERCPEIERATQGRVTRFQLRQDVFGSEPQMIPAAALQKAG